FDEVMRELALARYQDVERELGPVLVRFAVDETVRRFRQAGDLHWPGGAGEESSLDALAQKLTPKYGFWLAKHPSLEDVTSLTSDTARTLKEIGAITDPASALTLKPSPAQKTVQQIAEFFGIGRRTFGGEVLQALDRERMAQWRQRVKEINWEL